MSDGVDTDQKPKTGRVPAPEKAQAQANRLGLMPRVAEVLAAEQAVSEAREVVTERVATLDFKLSRLVDGGLNPAEIAHVTGMAEGTVRSALDRWNDRNDD